MELFKTTYQNGAFKRNYSLNINQSSDIPYFNEMLFIFSEYEDKGIFYDQCYIKEPGSDTFVPLSQISYSGNYCGENCSACASYLRPVAEENYNSKLFIKTDFQKLLLIDGYESSTDMYFMEHISKEELVKLNIEETYKFDKMPDDIYIPLHVFEMSPEKYFFSYRRKFTKDYDTFCNIIDFSAVNPCDNIPLTSKSWNVYRDGGTTEATLVDNYGNEHQLHVDTAFNPERKAIFDDQEYITLKRNTEEFKQITEKIAKFLNIKLFKSRR